MVNDFDGEAACFRFGERARHVAIEGFPGFFVDLGFQAGLQRLVGIVRAKKIGMADKEAFFVVIRVDEPGGDVAKKYGVSIAKITRGSNALKEVSEEMKDFLQNVMRK